MKCLLCQENIKAQSGTRPPVIDQFFGPDIQASEGIFDHWEMHEHMSFRHGFVRAHDNNKSKTAVAYRCVVEEVEVNGKTYHFGDYIEEQPNGKLLHVPGGIYPNNDTVNVTRVVEGTITFPGTGSPS